MADCTNWSLTLRAVNKCREVLQFLVDCAKETEFGRKHLFNHIKSYDDYVRNVPVNDYETLKGDIDRMRLARRISFGRDW